MFVLIFSYIVLLPLMRSMVLPLKADHHEPALRRRGLRRARMVFQYGWFDSIIGFDHSATSTR